MPKGSPTKKAAASSPKKVVAAPTFHVSVTAVRIPKKTYYVRGTISDFSAADQATLRKLEAHAHFKRLADDRHENKSRGVFYTSAESFCFSVAALAAMEEKRIASVLRASRKGGRRASPRRQTRRS